MNGLSHFPTGIRFIARQQPDERWPVNGNWCVMCTAADFIELSDTVDEHGGRTVVVDDSPAIRACQSDLEILKLIMGVK